MGQTGIEIHAIMTGATKLQGKLLKLVGFEGLNVAGLEMVITVDGAEKREVLYEAHFVPCTPGEHNLAIAWAGGPMTNFIKKMSTRSLSVQVPEGQVAIVEYTPGDQIGNSFAKVATAGTRPA
jgi:hypothetical protein